MSRGKRALQHGVRGDLGSSRSQNVRIAGNPLQHEERHTSTTRGKRRFRLLGSPRSQNWRIAGNPLQHE